MEPIHIMINGLPGNMAHVAIRHALADARFLVLPVALTGPEVEAGECYVEGRRFELIQPCDRDQRIAEIQARYAPFISIDFTHPSGVAPNIQFYCRHLLPFVMGTTGGNPREMAETVVTSNNTAVIAPNMAKQIVGFQAMMAYAAKTFPNLFKGYRLGIRESHQSGKADTSGTAKAMVAYFNEMGVAFEAGQIEKERDPERQSNLWGIPTEYLGGHGWHTYTLTSGDGTVKFEFTHNVNGREIYAEGCLDAVCFLARKLAEGATSRVFSMIDVLMEDAT